MINKEIEPIDEFTEEQQEVLRSIRSSRIIFPILIGIAVVVYLFLKEFNPEDFYKIKWTSHAWLWIGISFSLLILRHIAYATRLRILSEGVFSWKKCIELIFIWEFSSAVTPTSVGGSAVAFFVLSQEKLPAAKTATIVLYTVVLDTIFFVGLLPILLLLIGPTMIRPELTTWTKIDIWGYYFLIAYVLMAIYGSVFYYGLFVNPIQLKRVLVGMTKIRLLKKFRQKAIDLGNEMVIASLEMKQKHRSFHLGAFAATATAWSCRFLLLNCLIIALGNMASTDLFSQFSLYGRLQTMFIVIAFSPTPGGAGFVEGLFFPFVSDYVSNATSATIIATIWRLMTYYSYLLIGAIIIPNWIRQVINNRKKKVAVQSDNENI